VRFECEVVIGLPIRRHPLVLLCYYVLHIFNSTLTACVVINELVFSHKERSRGLGRVYVPIQVLSLHHAASHRAIDKGSVGSEISVRGELAT